MEFHRTKLVRDKTPEYLTEKGEQFVQREVAGEEYLSFLIEKLKQKNADFLETKSVEDLADIMEVIRTLRRLPEYSEAKTLQRKKRHDCGGYDDGIVITRET